MARKKKKSSKHTRRGRAKAAASRAAGEEARSNPKQLESLAEQAFEAGNFARAHEGFKRLHRLDPEKFVVLFAKSTLLAAGELLEKERYAECLDLLREFAAFEKISTAKERDTAKRLEQCCQISHSNRKIRIAAAAAIIEDDSIASPQIISQAADVLVLEKHDLAGDITSAIKALCGKDWNQLDLALKKIPRQSPFAGWRVFVTGCAAFHREDKPLARKCFSRLDAGTLPDKKADAYRSMLGDLNPTTHSGARLELENLLGKKALFKHLEEADRYWRKSNPDRVRKALLRINGFPGFQINLAGHLTRNFLNRLHGSDSDSIYDMVTPDLPGFLKNPKPGAMSFFRAIPLLSAFGEGDDDAFPGLKATVEKQWDLYEKSFISFFGNAPRFRAMIELVRAKQAVAFSGMSFSIFDDGPPDLSVAIPFLEKAIALDPKFEEPHFMLLGLHESVSDKRAGNKLLDLMSERFPESPEILKLTGERCMARSAFKKAIDCFERAEAIDPIDRTTKQQLYKANVKLAISHVANNKAHLLRPVLERLPRYSQATDGPVFYLDEFRAAFSDIAWLLTKSAKELEPPDLSNACLEKEMPCLLNSFYRQTAWDFIYFSSSKFRLGITPIPKLPKPTKNKVSVSDGLKMLNLLVEQLGLLHSMVASDWLIQYVFIAIRNLKKNELLSARNLGLLITTGISACKDFAEPLAKKTKELDSSDVFFQIFRAVIEERFTQELDEVIGNLNDAQSRDAQLSEIILRYEELRDRESSFGFPRDFNPFGFTDDDFDDGEDFDLPPSPPFPLPAKAKPKSQAAKKAPGKNKPATPEADSNAANEDGSGQEEFDFF